MDQKESQWNQINSNGYYLIKIIASRLSTFKWNLVQPNAIQWNQVQPSATKCNQVQPSAAKGHLKEVEGEMGEPQKAQFPYPYPYSTFLAPKW